MQTDVYFPLSQPTQANSSTRLSAFNRHLQLRLTCPHRRFLVFVTVYTGQPFYMGIFFSLTQPTQAFSSTQTLSSFRGQHRTTCPHGHFLLTDVAHAGLLIRLTHTGFFQPLCSPHLPICPHGHFLPSVVASIGLLDYTDDAFLSSFFLFCFTAIAYVDLLFQADHLFFLSNQREIQLSL